MNKRSSEFALDGGGMEISFKACSF